MDERNLTTVRDHQGGVALHPEENDPPPTLQASCKHTGKRLRTASLEALLGLIWAVLAFVSIVTLLASNSGVTDFRYVGF
jgi:hypothetical protein